MKESKLNHKRAQCDVGYCYAYGEGVEEDFEQAVYWYTNLQIKDMLKLS